MSTPTKRKRGHAKPGRNSSDIEAFEAWNDQPENDPISIKGIMLPLMWRAFMAGYRAGKGAK